jgi:hypothetical protein
MNDAIVVESIQELQERHSRKGFKALPKSAEPSPA